MPPHQMPAAALVTLRRRLRPPGPPPIGFPPATDIDFRPLADLYRGIINNLGDPERDGREPRNAKDFEREVIAQLIVLFGGDQNSCWGYVTQAGSTEGNQYGMWLARERYPAGVLYWSSAAHFSVPKTARLLGYRPGDTVVIPADDRGEVDYAALARAAAARGNRPAIVVATVGTTMTEAIDDVARIHAALDGAGASARHVHVDAALSGVPLALDNGPISRLLRAPVHGRRRRSDADSICVSGHKFFATPHITGVALTRREHAERVTRGIDYIDSLDGTISGSRSGHSVVELWYSLTHIGLDGHRRRVEQSRALAAYLEGRLVAGGWTAWRHPHAFTVVLKSPPSELITRWSLASSNGWSHIICVPGLDQEMIDQFLYELGIAPSVPQHSPSVLRAASA